MAIYFNFTLRHCFVMGCPASRVRQKLVSLIETLRIPMSPFNVVAIFVWMIFLSECAVGGSNYGFNCETRDLKSVVVSSKLRLKI